MNRTEPFSNAYKVSHTLKSSNNQILYHQNLQLRDHNQGERKELNYSNKYYMNQSNGSLQQISRENSLEKIYRSQVIAENNKENRVSYLQIMEPKKVLKQLQPYQQHDSQHSNKSSTLEGVQNLKQYDQPNLNQKQLQPRINQKQQQLLLNQQQGSTKQSDYQIQLINTNKSLFEQVEISKQEIKRLEQQKAMDTLNYKQLIQMYDQQRREYHILLQQHQELINKNQINQQLISFNKLNINYPKIQYKLNLIDHLQEDEQAQNEENLMISNLSGELLKTSMQLQEYPPRFQVPIDSDFEMIKKWRKFKLQKISHDCKQIELESLKQPEQKDPQSAYKKLNKMIIESGAIMQLNYRVDNKPYLVTD